MIDDRSRAPKADLLEGRLSADVWKQRASTQRPQELMCFCREKKKT